MSAGAPTMVPLTLAELLAVLGSLVVELTEAASLKLDPTESVAGAKTVSVKESEFPDAIAAVAVSVTVVLEPPWVKMSEPVV
jgi:hypothetical protein